MQLQWESNSRYTAIYIVWCSVNCATKAIAIGTEAGSNVEHHMNLNKGLP